MNQENNTTHIFFPKKVFVDDPFSFTLLWSDGKIGVYSLAALQRSCPCTMCTANVSLPAPLPPLRATRIKSIGRYGLTIQFETGCSRGIYSYAFLRTLL